MSSAVVVLGGDPPSNERLAAYAEKMPIFAADRGALSCLEADVVPEFVLGDFDSANVEVFPSDWDLRHRPDQEATDFEKLIAELPEHVDQLIVLGGLGGRLDHQWNNLLIATALPPDWEVSFESDEERLIRITPVLPTSIGDPGEVFTVSLLPVGDVSGICTTGFRWDLTDGTLGAGKQLSQSNELLGAGTIQVEKGVLFISVNRQEHR